MTNTDIVAAATAEARKPAGYHFDPSLLAAAVDEGLVAGNRIDIGGGAWATVEQDGDSITVTRKGAKVGEMTIATMTAAQRDRMLVLKAVQTSRLSSEMGSIA